MDMAKRDSDFSYEDYLNLQATYKDFLSLGDKKKGTK
jgi:hypothetical protein